MTRNFPNDNTTYWAGTPRALLNAHNLEVVVSGCDPSKGTGDWDVDITSGSIIAGSSNGEVTVSSATQDLSDPTSDMSSGQERIVIVTVNSSGNTNSVEGTAVASNPTTPDIPSGEVLIASVHVENGDSTLADSDIFDQRVLFGPSTYPFAATDLESTGNIYYYNAQDNRMEIYDISAGTTSTSAQTGSQGGAMAGDADGNLYYYDAGNDQVITYDISADSFSTTSVSATKTGGGAASGVY